MKGTPPLARTSSVPASCSPRKPKNSAERGPHRLPPGQGHRLDGEHPGECQQRPAGHGEADPDGLPPQQGEHRHQQHQVAQHPDDEGGEELRQGGHVAVDALDELTRRVGFVEAHVEVQDVLGEVGAQIVGGPPADLLGHVGRGHVQHLMPHGQGGEAAGQGEEPAQRAPGGSPVEKGANQLRVDRLAGEAGSEQHGEQRHPAAQRPQVSAQEAEVGTDRDHGIPRGGRPRAADGRVGEGRATTSAGSAPGDGSADRPGQQHPSGVRNLM